MKITNNIYLLIIVIGVFMVAGCDNPSNKTTQVTDDRPQKMVKEAERYYNYYYDPGWLVRTSATDTIGDWYYSGMPYSYGNKDTIEHFVTKMDADGSVISWDEYSSYKTGLLTSETNWDDPNYMPTKWAGIDCSGFVQRCAYAAGYRFSGVSWEGNIGNGQFNTFGGEIYSQDFKNYFSQWITDNYSNDVDLIEPGDIVIYSGHVAMVSTIEGSVVKVLNSLGAFDYDPPYQVVECKIGDPYSLFNVYRWPRK